MSTSKHKVLVWLPSPLGDAIMATPALRSFRFCFPDAEITFFGSDFTRQILSPSPFCDGWLEVPGGFLKKVRALKSGSFDTAILLKNSFGSALAVCLAGIGRRIGYVREGRSLLLTNRIRPQRDGLGKFKPAPMIDYYLEIAGYLNGPTDHRKTELSVSEQEIETLKDKIPLLNSASGPVVILVPGGAFGPSKLWPIDRYALLADRLHEMYNARIILSVAPVTEEIEIAEAIRNMSQYKPIHIGEIRLSGGQLKALYSLADLVITNDTGPRHIAIALDKPVVSLFGPNNPAWTQTDHDMEVQIIGKAPCVPCDKPVCRQSRHLCMESITVDQVLEAVKTFSGVLET